jgi:biopolymer transport protein ExbD
MLRKLRQPPFEEEEPPINIMPLLDVVFVLLITYMLLAPMLRVDHVELAASGTTSQKEIAKAPLALTVRADQTLWFQGKQVSFPELRSLLTYEKGKTPQVIVDKNCKFGLYQDVKNLLEECGFQQMDVILQ